MKKKAIITGCAKGIGKQIALTLARDGYDIIATYNTSYDDIILLKNKIENIGVNFEYYKVDLLDENEINFFCNDIIDKDNNIDVLVNNVSMCVYNYF